jgi:hypothetical protein
VDLTGATQSRLVVKLDPAKLAATGISVSQIQGILAANNLVLPAGAMPVTNADNTTISIPVSAQHQLILKSTDDLLALIVGVKKPAAGSTDAPTPVTLGDLGTIQQVATYPTGYAELNKDPQHGDRRTGPGPQHHQDLRRQHGRRRPGGSGQARPAQLPERRKLRDRHGLGLRVIHHRVA